MKKSFRIFTALLICIALILPVYVHASENSLDFSSSTSKVEYSTLGMLSTDQLKNAKLSEKDVPEALLVRNADTSSFVHRVRSLEDEYSLVYQNSDGTNTMLQFTTSIQYRDADGNLRDKSTKTQLIDGQHVTTENDVKVSIPQNLEQGVSLEFDGYALAMKPTGMVSSISSVAKMDSELKTAADTSIYKYSGLYDANTDIVYSPAFSGVKCDIVLKQYTGRSEFEFAVLLKGLHLEKDDNEKIIYMLNSDNEKVAYFNTVMSYDSNGKVSIGDMDFEQLGEGQYIVTLKVDEGFLTDEETVYPVTVDPSATRIELHDPVSHFEYLAIYSDGTSQHSRSYSVTDLIVGSHQEKGFGRVLYKFSDMSRVAPIKNITKIELLQCARISSDLGTMYAYAYKGSPWSASSTFASSAEGYDLSYAIEAEIGENYTPYAKYMRIDITNFYRTCQNPQNSSSYSLDKGIELYNLNGENCLEIQGYDSFIQIATGNVTATPEAASFAPYISLTYEPYRIIVDAGHFLKQNYIKFTYNGIEYEYYEGNQMWQLHEYLVLELKKRGFDVDKVRDENKPIIENWDNYNAASRAEYIARGKKAAGYDLLLSLHSNGLVDENDNPIVNVRRVVVEVTKTADPQSHVLASALANSVKTTMGITQDSEIYKNNHILLTTAIDEGCARAFIIEHSFHTNPESAYWLMNNANLQELAIAEAEAVEAFYCNLN